MKKKPTKKAIRVEFDDPKEHREVMTHLTQRGFKASPFIRWFLGKLVGGESSAAEFLAAEYEQENEDADDDE